MAEPGPTLAWAPPGGLWHIGRAEDPFRSSRLDPADAHLPGAGNRFDLPEVGITYVATDLEGCFAETLARFRPSPAVQAAIQDDWRGSGFMAPGTVAADWRHRRLAVRAVLSVRLPFLDIESPWTRTYLTKELAQELVALQVDDLDVAAVRGRDRRVTRAMARWAFEARRDEGLATYAGLRYVSRLGDWECWAVFDDVPLAEVGRMAITRDTPGLQEAARALGLRVF